MQIRRIWISQFETFFIHGKEKCLRKLGFIFTMFQNSRHNCLSRRRELWFQRAGCAQIYLFPATFKSDSDFFKTTAALISVNISRHIATISLDIER